MKIVVATQQGDTAPLVQRLQEEGHEVSLFVGEEKYAGTCKNLVTIVDLPTVLETKPDLVVLLENSSKGLAEYLSSKGLMVVGGFTLNRVLEDDRPGSLSLVSQCGIQIPKTFPFTEGKDAIELLKESDLRLCVKVNDDGGDKYMSFLGKSNDDVIHFIEKKYQKEKHKGLVLQEFIEGPAEVNTEIWFSKGEPIWPANGGMEQKRFLSGDMGPNTGCMATLTWPLERIPKVWTSGLLSYLKQQEYTGPLDMAFKVGEDYELYFLEFTPRLGINAGFGIVDLFDGDFGEWLLDFANGDARVMPLRNEFCALITISVYPYPYEIPAIYLPGSEVKFDKVEHWDGRNFWPAFIELKDGKYVTAQGYPLVGHASSCHREPWYAVSDVKQVADQIAVSGKQWRNDTDKLVEDLMVAEYVGFRAPWRRMYEHV